MLAIVVTKSYILYFDINAIYFIFITLLIILTIIEIKYKDYINHIKCRLLNLELILNAYINDYRIVLIIQNNNGFIIFSIK